MKHIPPKLINTNVWTFNQLPVNIEGKVGKKAVSNKGKKVRSASKIKPKIRSKKGK